MPGQWAERGLYLWGHLCCILELLYGILWVIPVACLSLPVTLPFILRSPGYNRSNYDPIRLVWYAPISLYKWTLSVYQNRSCAGYRRQRPGKKFRRLEPAALPSLRKRTLSQGHTRPQTQSSFLTKLPLEIRQIIYEEVIRDGTLHRHIIELKNIKIGARNQLCGIGCEQFKRAYCNSPATHDICSMCGTVANAPETLFSKTGSSCGPLALVKSCRQIYLEMIDLFYGQ